MSSYEIDTEMRCIRDELKTLRAEKKILAKEIRHLLTFDGNEHGYHTVKGTLAEVMAKLRGEVTP